MDPSTVITPDTTATVIDNGALLLAYLGAAGSIVFSGAGAAYGTWKSSKGIDRTEQQGFSPSTKYLVPVVIAGVLAIYGLIFSVIALQQINPELEAGQAYSIFGGGLTVGLCCLVSGIAVGKTALAGLPKAAESSRNFVGLCLLLVFCEAIGLYGLIASLLCVA